MQKKQRLLIPVIACLLVLGAGSALAGEQAAGAPQTLEAARALAAERGVPVLIDLFATWCGPCKTFDRASEEDAEIQAILGKVVLIKVDGEKGDGIPLAASTYVLLNEQGKTIRQWAGYEKSDFVENLGAGLEDPTTIEARLQRFESSPTSEDALILAGYYAAREETQKSFSFYEKAGDLNEDPDVDYSSKLFMVAYDGFRNEEVTAAQMVTAGERVLAWKGHSAEDAIYVARYLSAVGRKENNPEHRRDGKCLGREHHQAAHVGPD